MGVYDLVTADPRTALAVASAALVVVRSLLLLGGRLAFGAVAVVARLWKSPKGKSVSEAAMAVLRELGKGNRASDLAAEAAEDVVKRLKPKKPAG